jgi:hypothetical protein
MRSAQLDMSEDLAGKGYVWFSWAFKGRFVGRMSQENSLRISPLFWRDECFTLVVNLGTLYFVEL